MPLGPLPLHARTPMGGELLEDPADDTPAAAPEVVPMLQPEPEPEPAGLGPDPTEHRAPSRCASCACTCCCGAAAPEVNEEPKHSGSRPRTVPLALVKFYTRHTRHKLARAHEKELIKQERRAERHGWCCCWTLLVARPIKYGASRLLMLWTHLCCPFISWLGSLWLRIFSMFADAFSVLFMAVEQNTRYHQKQGMHRETQHNIHHSLPLMKQQNFHGKTVATDSLDEIWFVLFFSPSLLSDEDSTTLDTWNAAARQLARVTKSTKYAAGSRRIAGDICPTYAGRSVHLGVVDIDDIMAGNDELAINVGISGSRPGVLLFDNDAVPMAVHETQFQNLIDPGADFWEDSKTMRAIECLLRKTLDERREKKQVQTDAVTALIMRTETIQGSIDAYLSKYNDRRRLLRCAHHVLHGSSISATGSWATVILSGLLVLMIFSGGLSQLFHSGWISSVSPCDAEYYRMVGRSTWSISIDDGGTETPTEKNELYIANNREYAGRIDISRNITQSNVCRDADGHPVHGNVNFPWSSKFWKPISRDNFTNESTCANACQGYAVYRYWPACRDIVPQPRQGCTLAPVATRPTWDSHGQWDTATQLWDEERVCSCHSNVMAAQDPVAELHTTLSTLVASQSECNGENAQRFGAAKTFLHECIIFDTTQPEGWPANMKAYDKPFRYASEKLVLHRFWDCQMARYFMYLAFPAAFCAIAVLRIFAGARPIDYLSDVWQSWVMLTLGFGTPVVLMYIMNAAKEEQAISTIGVEDYQMYVAVSFMVVQVPIATGIWYLKEWYHNNLHNLVLISKWHMIWTIVFMLNLFGSIQVCFAGQLSDWPVTRRKLESEEWDYIIGPVKILLLSALSIMTSVATTWCVEYDTMAKVRQQQLDALKKDAKRRDQPEEKTKSCCWCFSGGSGLDERSILRDRSRVGGSKWASGNPDPHCQITVVPKSLENSHHKMTNSELHQLETNLELLLNIKINSAFENGSQQRVLDVKMDGYFSSSGKVVLNLYFSSVNFIKLIEELGDKKKFIHDVLVTPLTRQEFKVLGSLIEEGGLEGWPLHEDEDDRRLVRDTALVQEVPDRLGTSMPQVRWADEFEFSDVSMDKLARWYPAFFLNKCAAACVKRLTIASTSSVEIQILMLVIMSGVQLLMYMLSWYTQQLTGRIVSRCLCRAEPPTIEDRRKRLTDYSKLQAIDFECQQYAEHWAIGAVLVANCLYAMIVNFPSLRYDTEITLLDLLTKGDTDLMTRTAHAKKMYSDPFEVQDGWLFVMAIVQWSMELPVDILCTRALELLRIPVFSALRPHLGNVKVMYTFQICLSIAMIGLLVDFKTQYLMSDTAERLECNNETGLPDPLQLQMRANDGWYAEGQCKSDWCPSNQMCVALKVGSMLDTYWIDYDDVLSLFYDILLSMSYFYGTLVVFYFLFGPVSKKTLGDKGIAKLTIDYRIKRAVAKAEKTWQVDDFLTELGLEDYTYSLEHEFGCVEIQSLWQVDPAVLEEEQRQLEADLERRKVASEKDTLYEMVAQDRSAGVSASDLQRIFSILGEPVDGDTVSDIVLDIHLGGAELRKAFVKYGGSADSWAELAGKHDLKGLLESRCLKDKFLEWCDQTIRFQPLLEKLKKRPRRPIQSYVIEVMTASSDYPSTDQRIPDVYVQFLGGEIESDKAQDNENETDAWVNGLSIQKVWREDAWSSAKNPNTGPVRLSDLKMVALPGSTESSDGTILRFHPGTSDAFELWCEQLGDVSMCRVWLENDGLPLAWKCTSISITDANSLKKWKFDVPVASINTRRITGRLLTVEHTHDDNRAKRTVWMGNLPDKFANETVLRELLQSAGGVESVRVRSKHEPNTSWALVVFAKVHDATVFTDSTLRAQVIGDALKDLRITLIQPEKLRSHEAQKYLVPTDSQLVSSIEAHPFSDPADDIWTRLAEVRSLWSSAPTELAEVELDHRSQQPVESDVAEGSAVAADSKQEIYGYEIELRTSDLPRAGCSGEAYIQLGGEEGVGRFLRIADRAGRDLEMARGSVVQFAYPAPRLGNLKWCRVWHRQTGMFSSQWLLAEVRVAKPISAHRMAEDGSHWSFLCNRVVKDDTRPVLVTLTKPKVLDSLLEMMERQREAELERGFRGLGMTDEEVKILATAREILRTASQDPEADVEPGDERRNTRTWTRSESAAALATHSRMRTLNAGIKEGLHEQVGDFQQRMLISKERQLVALHDAQQRVEEDNRVAHAKIEALMRQERQVLAQYNSCQQELQRCQHELKAVRRRVPSAAATAIASSAPKQVDDAETAETPAPQPAGPPILGFASPDTKQSAELVTPTRIPAGKLPNLSDSEAMAPPPPLPDRAHALRGSSPASTTSATADGSDSPAPALPPATPPTADVSTKKEN